MIRLLMLLLPLAVLAGAGLLWRQVWGFDALATAHWRWLIAYTRQYHQPPDFILWGPLIAGLGMIAGLVLLPLILSRVGARTTSGGRGQKDLHGSAHWATWRDVKAAGLARDTGVVVGGWPGFRKTRLLRHDGPEHVLCFAPTRSGKGVGLVLPTLLSWPESTVVLDIKGENLAKSAGWRASQGQRILRFDPAALEGSVRFNPLAEVRLGSDYEIADAQNIAVMVIDPNGKGLQDFWQKSAFAWLSAAILHVLYRVRKEEQRTATLTDVGHYLAAPGTGLESFMKDMVVWDHDGRPAVNAMVHAAAQEMIDRAAQERSGVHSSALTELTLYRDPVIAANISASDFTVADLMNGEAPASLYLVVPPNEIDRLRPLLRVVLNILLRRLMDSRFGDAKPYRHRLLLMLDEFTSIGKLEIFERSLAFMAGYGLKAFLIVQDLTQLHAAYTKDESIVGNCHVRIAYAPNKIETAKALSEMCGKTTVVQKKRSRSGTPGQLLGNVSTSLAETSRPLLTPDECMRLRAPEKAKRDPEKIVQAGDILTFVAGRPPILGRQPLYFQIPDLLARSRLPVPAPAAPRP